MKGFYQLHYRGYLIIVENGMYRLPNHVTRFTSLEGMQGYINDLEKDKEELKNEIEKYKTIITELTFFNESSLK